MAQRQKNAIISSLFTVVWILVAWALIGNRFMLPFYCVWVFFGLAILGYVIKYSWFENSELAMPVIRIFAIVLAPIVSYSTFMTYESYDEARTLKALDRLIEGIEESGNLPSDFQSNISDGQLVKLRSDVSKEYEIVAIDFLLGEYDIVVLFENKSEYIFQIGDYGSYWNVYIHEQKNSK